MVNSHALRLVPASKESRFCQPFTSVSCTKSSARWASRHKDTANALRCGIAATKASRNESCLGRVTYPDPCALVRLILFAVLRVEKLEELEQLVRHRLLHQGLVNGFEGPPEMGLELNLRRYVGHVPGQFHFSPFALPVGIIVRIRSGHDVSPCSHLDVHGVRCTSKLNPGRPSETNEGALRTLGAHGGLGSKRGTIVVVPGYWNFSLVGRVPPHAYTTRAVGAVVAP